MAQNKEEKGVKSSVALDEERTLAFWDEIGAFQKSVEKEAPLGEYVFYDGPPFATGLPHYGHILGSAVKDTVARYQTMRGKRVERRWGWDCHGLPIENIVEKDFKISGKKEIEKIGVETFNEYARSKVLDYVAHWKDVVRRMGRWVDFDGSYKTMDNSFIESVWWAFGEMNKKGLVYEGTRVLPYCPRCETPIANSEIAMDNSYKDITDISVYVKLELCDEPNTFLLAWTTTPWTLPGNTAAAVNAETLYCTVEDTDENNQQSRYILAHDLFDKLKDKFKQPKVVSQYSGSKLIGKSYKPLFNYFSNNQSLPHYQNGWKVYGAPYVTTESGTGIVHLAPAYGEEDMQLAKENNIPFVRHVGPDGLFIKEVLDFSGEKAKPKEDHQSGDVLIIKNLAHRGLLFAKEKIIHSYPHCFRCETPLYYFALPAWFLNIQKVKHRMLELNQGINWVPEHLKDGRFGKSMEGAPDWNISRNRYWASPIPVWVCKGCSKQTFISSIEDIKIKNKRNTYFIMRHGEADHNVMNVLSSDPQNPHHLTENGEEEVKKAAQKLKDIDLIFASDFVRARETAKMVADSLGLSHEQIVYDARIGETNFGDYNLRHADEYRRDLPYSLERFDKSLPNGETYTEVKQRVGSFLYDIDSRFKNKRILIVTHEAPAWLISSVAQGLNREETFNFRQEDGRFINFGELRELSFVQLPHNKHFELDLHRPYIDAVTLPCECGEVQNRIPEVFDCWFESGSMPFAQAHYPFKNKTWFESHFPAQFIAEYIAQTRTWFYYMHAVSTMLFDRASFENVVTTGTVLALDGQKMSKSKGNFPDPQLLFDTYGVDAVRFYMLSSPLMKSEDLNFSEKGVDEVYKKIIVRTKNIVSFYELFKGQFDSFDGEESNHVLDKWILARLKETISHVTRAMESYELDRAHVPLEVFIDDLSTWYVRRSRDRLKDEGSDDQINGLRTFREVLFSLAHLLAPFAPFLAEEVYQKIKRSSDPESVHLSSWIPDDVTALSDVLVLSRMKDIRNLVSFALEARAKAGIKVRQPLRELVIKNDSLRGENDYLNVLMDEINVKQITFSSDISDEVFLDTHIDEELRTEGEIRELIRTIQEFRKQQGLRPDEVIPLSLALSQWGIEVLPHFKEEIKSVCGISDFTIIPLEPDEGEWFRIVS